jgi:hypothetical protein
MKLVGLTVSNYRSITSAYKLPIHDYTILVGPNNEGKSNLIRAIVLALGTLSRGHRLLAPPRRRLRFRQRDLADIDYLWDRDFPVSLQQQKPNGESEFTAEFKLNASEVTEFATLIGSNLSSNLRLKLRLGPDLATVEPVIQGPAKKLFSTRKGEIATFVADRLHIQYIPAQRTTELAQQVVDDLLAVELSQLESDPRYQQLIAKLDQLQTPIRKTLGDQLRVSMQSFLPDIRDVKLETDAFSVRSALRRSCRVIIDDGDATELDLKGDGAKSLAAISLIRHMTQRALAGQSLVLAIEEPESHLHPSAVHRLRRVLGEISVAHQVIISTHSPILVDREEVSRNILVQSGKAKKADKLSSVRDSLGVRISDNLSSADLVLLVEGETDRQVVDRFLRSMSPKLRAAMRDGRLAIESLGGASKLSSVADVFRHLLCNVHAYVDNDPQGVSAVEQACKRGSLCDTEYTLIRCQGMHESELEDLIKPSLYKKAFTDEFGVQLAGSKFQNSKKKWSDRAGRVLVAAGKLWGDPQKSRAKSLVAQLAVQEGPTALLAAKRSSFDALVKALESRLSPG